MNVQLAQSLKVISILSTQTLVQNVALVQMHVRLKQLAWANTISKSMTNGCPSQRGSRFFRLKSNVIHFFTCFIRGGPESIFLLRSWRGRVFSLPMKVVEGINAVASGWKVLLVPKNSGSCLHLFVNHRRWLTKSRCWFTKHQCWLAKPRCWLGYGSSFWGEWTELLPGMCVWMDSYVLPGVQSAYLMRNRGGVKAVWKEKWLGSP